MRIEEATPGQALLLQSLDDGQPKAIDLRDYYGQLFIKVHGQRAAVCLKDGMLFTALAGICEWEPAPGLYRDGMGQEYLGLTNVRDALGVLLQQDHETQVELANHDMVVVEKVARPPDHAGPRYMLVFQNEECLIPAGHANQLAREAEEAQSRG